MEFRRALMNPITAHQFRRYVSLKGDFFENDVLFWLEVQKYKARTVCFYLLLRKL